MKLRPQFIIMVVGILAVPLLIVPTLIFLRNTIIEGEVSGTFSKELTDYRRNLPDLVKKVDLESLFKQKPAAVDLAVVEEDGRVSLSTIAGIPAGAVNGSSLILGQFANRSRDSLLLVYPFLQGGRNDLLVVRMPKSPTFFFLDPMSAIRNEPFFFLLMSLIAVAGLFSLFIARGLVRSVARLELATKKIAAGDLDLDLPSRGNSEIDLLSRSFLTMANKLKEAEEKRSRFIMGVSHDLKTPIGLIMGYVEAIEDGYAGDPDSLKKYLGIIRERAGILESMIESLIDFARLETGEWLTRLTGTRAADYFGGLALRYQEDANLLERKLKVNLDIPSGLVIQIDQLLATRAFENILGNALRYTQAGDTITFSARVESGTPALLLEIRDTGPGIPPEDLQQVFDPFFRGSNSRREEGTGLGLSIVAAVVRAHGWKIEIESPESRGVAVLVRIPC